MEERDARKGKLLRELRGDGSNSKYVTLLSLSLLFLVLFLSLSPPSLLFTRLSQ